MALGVTVDFTANIANFTNQINRISGNLDQFQRHAETMSSRISKSLSAIGAGLSVGGLVAFTKASIDALDNLNDLSLKTNVAVETLAGFDLVSKQSGTDLESFATALNKLSVNIGKNREEFDKLGISAKDPTEAFLQFADVFNSIQDPQEKAAFGAKALGKAYAEMAPTLSLGSEELRKLVKQGQEASKATTSLAKEADQFNDTIALMQARLGGLATIAGGATASAFNNLVDSIGAATEAGVTFNNVMAGIGAAFAHKQMFTGVAGELDKVNKEIDVTEKKVNAIKNNGAIGKLIDDLAGNDINLEKNRLDGLYKKQEQLAGKLKESLTPAPLKIPKTPTAQAVRSFIGGGSGEDGDKSKHGRKARAGSDGRPSGLSEEQRAAEQLQSTYQSMLESLQKEIALRDKNTEVAKVQYEVINGSLKGLGPAQEQNLINLAKETDALERQQKQWDALVESANARYDIKQSNKDLIKTGDIQSGFNQALADTQDQFKAGTITEEEAKAEYAKLGAAFNSEFISPAQKGANELNVFVEQAAKNMQSAFADFLFNPMDKSFGDMANSFATTLQRMAAEAVSAMLMKKIFGDGSTIGGGATSGGGWLDQFVSWLGTAASVAKSANGNIFNQGNVVAFARGGIFDKPHYFPMAHNKIGLLGEAGPEAIMPLSKTGNGALGVRVHGETGANSIMPLSRGSDGKLGVKANLAGNIFNAGNLMKFALGDVFNKTEIVPFAKGGVFDKTTTPTPMPRSKPMTPNRPGQPVNIIVNVSGSNSAPDVRRAAGQGAREALGFMGNAQRYA